MAGKCLDLLARDKSAAIGQDFADLHVCGQMPGHTTQHASKTLKIIQNFSREKTENWHQTLWSLSLKLSKAGVLVHYMSHTLLSNHVIQQAGDFDRFCLLN